MLRRTLARLTWSQTMKYGQMSDMYDPRVVYSKEPWNNPLKQSTGMSGLAPDHKWRKKLITLYTAILDEVRMVPESNIYRQSTENVYREFLRIVTNVGDTDWRIVERKIGLGQVEQLVIMAMDERELVQAYSEWKLWLIPMETVREVQEECKADSYFEFAGPPEPYLSDEEINDLKKVDQQRMAEEQKLLAQDVKKLTGRTSRMIQDDAEERQRKRQEYEEALQRYIRETQLDRAYELRGDGSAKSYVSRHEEATPVHGIGNTEVRSSFEEDAARRVDAFTDWQEHQYYVRGTESTTKDFGPWGAVYDGKVQDPKGPDSMIPNRLQLWSAKKSGLVDDLPTDIPRGAPVAKEGMKGRLIPKWRKPEDVLHAGQETPVIPASVSKEFRGPPGPGPDFKKWSDE